MPQGRRPGYRVRRTTDPVLLEAIMDGVSVFDTVNAARAQNEVFASRWSGSPFRYIAALNIPDSSLIECDDAFGNAHHWDLYGSRADLLATVAPPDIEL